MFCLVVMHCAILLYINDLHNGGGVIPKPATTHTILQHALHRKKVEVYVAVDVILRYCSCHSLSTAKDAQ